MSVGEDRPRPGGDGPEFLERLAHDLRGPLSPLQTAAYLLRRGDLESDRQRELLEIIDRQTMRLSSMVQEVSDWMRARRSRLVAHREVQAVSLLLELGCATRAGKVVLEVPPELDEAMLEADTQRLVQMLETLLQWTEARGSGGRAIVTADVQGPEVRITLRAPSVEWTDAEPLFDAPQAVPFDEGLGMRLLIARAIAEAHGGSITALGAVGGGMLFEIRLPLRR